MCNLEIHQVLMSWGTTKTLIHQVFITWYLLTLFWLYYKLEDITLLPMIFNSILNFSCCCNEKQITVLNFLVRVFVHWIIKLKFFTFHGFMIGFSAICKVLVNNDCMSFNRRKETVKKFSIIGHSKSKFFITLVLEGGTKSLSILCSASQNISQLIKYIVQMFASLWFSLIFKAATS
jgi:hypothetical protein